MFKRLVKYKGSNIFERGVWVGKHPFNDNHIVLTPNGAYESRTIRRLSTAENFSGVDIFTAKGLPWSYSPQRILMKHAGQAQKYRQPTLEVEASEEEMKEIANAVASGVVTPAPGLQGQPMTPAMIGNAAPATPATRREDVQESPKNVLYKLRGPLRSKTRNMRPKEQTRQFLQGGHKTRGH